MVTVLPLLLCLYYLLDSVIKRKLLIEGESGMDDKRFAVLLKDYLRWASSDETSEARYKATLLNIFEVITSISQF